MPLARALPTHDETTDQTIAAVDNGPLVEIENVHKTFGPPKAAVRALDGVSLAIHANEFFTLLGPSGCGKTTVLRMLAGFEHPDSGGIKLGGADVLADPPHERPVNMVFQSYALFPHLSVARNIAFGLERLGQARPAIAARVEAMLRLVGLDAMADRKPDALSGGQRQRVALARALAPRPKLLLLDEPMSALDPALRRGMRTELKRLQRETGITFLLVTHDQEEALSLSDRIAVMEGGRVRQVGTPVDIHDRPTSRFVATFMGATILPGPLVGFAAPHAAIPPGRILLSAEAGAGAGFPGRVTAALYRGSHATYTIALDAGLVIDADQAGAPVLAPGALVTCAFPPDALVPLEA